MYWYGWTATTLIVPAVLGLLATKLPESTIRKIPLSLTWIAAAGRDSGADLCAAGSSGGGSDRKDRADAL